MIYLDNAATSWPKPDSMLKAMIRYQEDTGANPGRSGHKLSVEAGRVVYEARSNIAELLNVEDPLNIVFAQNATAALNLAIKGNLKAGDHVITTGMEHNSVMRPLREMEKGGVEISVLHCGKEGFLDVNSISSKIRSNTRMLVVNHASNVTGSLAPVNEIGELTANEGILLLVDAAQTAGSFPIDVRNAGIDLLAFTGHKSLLGPQGTGGLAIGENVDIDSFKPLLSGGTGSKSESEEHPEFLPDKYESGTPNTIGLAGLAAGIKFVLDTGVENIRKHEMELAVMLIKGLEDIPGVTVYGTRDPEKRTATVSINLKGAGQNEVGQVLDEDFGIMSRVGLHCAPQAHRTIGTFPDGTVRLSIGYFNSPEDIQKTIRAINAISKESQ
ncbi:MAG: aminotransferase class V-fold PLP-dependent enzyme [Actinobacteria bacterium]|nr:aminotransferase class V-fold PLP-dependent enzyme [Actinomycetota bacterium]